jgi:uncharacterized C2H2 Zn-finger protein
MKFLFLPFAPSKVSFSERGSLPLFPVSLALSLFVWFSLLGKGLLFLGPTVRPMAGRRRVRAAGSRASASSSGSASGDSSQEESPSGHSGHPTGRRNQRGRKRSRAASSDAEDHDVETGFKCPICPSSSSTTFKDRGSCQRHVRKFHKNLNMRDFEVVKRARHIQDESDAAAPEIDVGREISTINQRLEGLHRVVNSAVNEVKSLWQGAIGERSLQDSDGGALNAASFGDGDDDFGGGGGFDDVDEPEGDDVMPLPVKRVGPSGFKISLEELLLESTEYLRGKPPKRIVSFRHMFVDRHNNIVTVLNASARQHAQLHRKTLKYAMGTSSSCANYAHAGFRLVHPV